MTTWNVSPQPKPSPTFQGVVDRAKAGDTVRVAAGDYPEDVRVTKALTIVCEKGATVRSFQWSSVTGGSLVGLSAVGPKTPLGQPVELTIPDANGVAINGQLPQASRIALARIKWRTVMALVDAYFSPYSIGIKVSGCRGTRIQGCYASRHTAGISVEDSREVVVQDCSADQCSTGIRAFKSDHVAVTVCDVTECLGTGITLDDTHDSAVTSCEAKHCGIGNYLLQNGASRNLVSKCRGWWSGYFSETMELPGSSSFNAYAVGPGNVFEACWSESQKDPTGNDGNGFIADTSPSGVTFRTCTAINCAGAGVALTKTNGNTVTGNKLVGNAKAVRLWQSTGNTIGNNG